MEWADNIASLQGGGFLISKGLGGRDQLSFIRIADILVLQVVLTGSDDEVDLSQQQISFLTAWVMRHGHDAVSIQLGVA